MKKKILIPTILATVGALCVTAQTLTPEAEAEIENKVARILADMRTLHTGLEAYRVDNNVYPSRLTSITTPISYLAGTVPDPFEAPLAEDAAIPEHLNPEGGQFGWPGVIKLGIRPNNDTPFGPEFIAYSVGPDGVDDRGAIEYDPSNGIISKGDIVRVIGREGLPIVAYKSEIAKQVIETARAQGTVYEAIVSWAMVEQSFPPNLNALTTPVAYLDSVPEDPFLPGLPIGYRLSTDGDKNEAIVYSVGPDLVDDLGQRGRLNLTSEEPENMDGDLSRIIQWSEIENRLRPFKDESEYKDGIHPWKAALMEWQENNGGRENAFLWYHEATVRGPGVPTQDQQNALDAVLKGDLANVDKLRPWLNVWSESFVMIKQGRELDFAEGPGNSAGFATPVPNFLSAQLSGKALVASALISLEEGDTDQAVDYLKSALIMGRDYQSEGSMFISHLIGYALTNITTQASTKAIESGKLSHDQLADLRTTMLHVERTREPLSVAVQIENSIITKSIEKAWMSKEIPLEEMNEFIEEEGYSPLEKLPNLELFTKPLTAYGEYVMIELAKPIYQRDFSQAQFDQFIENSFTEDTTDTEKFLASKILGDSGIDYPEAGAREATMQAKLDLTRTASAIHSWKIETGLLPASLEEVAPLLGGSVPKDPYSGKALNYSIGEENTWKLWSIGPDESDDLAAVQYDPSNGTVSDGDIIYPFE